MLLLFYISRLLNQTAETTFIYNNKHDAHGPCPEMPEEFSETECDRDDLRRVRESSEEIISLKFLYGQVCQKPHLGHEEEFIW